MRGNQKLVLLCSAALVIVALNPISLLAQTTLGTILGRISDSSGASIVSATVTLRNTNTGISVTKASGRDGQYVFPNIVPGTYQIQATATGFASYSLDGINVAVSQTVREDISLPVGKSTATVQVQAEHPLVQTDTSSTGAVIESEQVNQMPLNGRTDIFGLLALAPGVQGSGTDARISGNSWIGTNETMDGVTNMESENSRLSSADPSLDSIQEFRVIDSTGSAEYGGGTAQVILSSKSGTNSYHGSLFVYERNRVLSARNYFNPPNSVKPPYDREEFGGSLGGPIKRDKIFFFGSYEGLLFHSSTTSESAQPTSALLNGNFAGLPAVTDPTTGQPFPGNQIPTSRFSSVSQAFFRYFDTPNLGSTAPGGLGTNYVAIAPSRNTNFRYQGRVDYTLSPKDSLFVRYYYTDTNENYSGVTEKMGGGRVPLTQQNLAVNYTRVITPNLVNLATYGSISEVDHYYSQNNSVNPSTIIPGLTQEFPGLGGLPTISITGFTGIVDTINAGDDIPTYDFSDVMTWSKGNHTVKGGFFFTRYQFFDYGNSGHGNFSFTGQYTGNAFADYLLGYLAGSSQSDPAGAIPRNERYSWFGQDDWRVTPRLTLNYGLRYDLPTLFSNVQGGFAPTGALSFLGGMANWYPELNQIVVLKGTGKPASFPGVPFVAGSSVGLNRGNYLKNDLWQWGPRLGFIYSLLSNSKLIVRGGYGLYYEAMPWKFGSFDLAVNPPFAASESFEPLAGNTPSLFFNNPFPTNSAIFPSEVGVNAEAKNLRYPRTNMWNLTLESQLSPNTAVRISYLGSSRIHSGALESPNTPPLAPGPIQPRRPYQPFGAITLYDNVLTSDTNQLQIGALRTFSSGLSYGLQYSFIKTLNSQEYDATPPTDPQNLAYDRGNDPLIRHSSLVANYVYELPFGRGKHFLSSLPPVANAVLGNWETSGIVTLQSGLPYSVTFDSSVQGWTSSRADIVGNPHVSNRGLQQWFNPAAFGLPAPYTYGNSGANAFFGPGYNDWDLGVFKNFILPEKVRLQFRTEFFNAINHPAFSNPISDISSPSVATVNSTSNSPRVIQFALRADF